MGYGVPAAIAAKLVHPDRPALCIAGDGDFLMSAKKLATAVQHELPIIVLVVDNGMYGTIRMRQERDYPGRVSGTELVNPDFTAFARSFGAHAEMSQAPTTSSRRSSAPWRRRCRACSHCASTRRRSRLGRH